MRQSKFTETKAVSLLKDADTGTGRPVNEIWWHYGISSAPSISPRPSSVDKTSKPAA